MKKLLAMVLALVMTLSLAVSANAAFEDAKDINATYAEAVDVLAGMKVFQGYDNGKTFKPQGDITRAEVAAIVYRIYTADVKDSYVKNYETYNKFSDMAGAGWAKGYIGYCANAALVKGYPNGTFQPSGKVTGYEVLAMILRAVGYDKNGEFTGTDWALHVAQIAEQNKILKNVKGIDLSAPASRELVAELLFQAIQVPTVTYTAAFGYQDVSLTADKKTDKLVKANSSLGYKNFKLVSGDDSDDWGRPVTVWAKDANDNGEYDAKKDTTVYATVVATPDVATSQCDICEALGVKKTTTVVDTYTNGVKDTEDVTYTATATKAMVGAQGEQLEYYKVDGGYRLVVIDTYLAQVNEVFTEKTDDKGHTTRDAYMSLDVYKASNGEPTTLYVKGNDYAEEDWVLVNVNDEVDVSIIRTTNKTAQKSDLVEIVAKAESFEGAQTSIWSKSYKHTIDGKDYDDAVKFYLDDAKSTGTANYTWFLDQFGNLIGSKQIANDNYAVLKDIIWKTGVGAHAEGTLVYMDGTEKTGVEIASIDGLTTTVDGEFSGDFTKGNNNSVTEQTYTDVKFENHFVNVSTSDKYNDAFKGMALYLVETDKDGVVSLQGIDKKTTDTSDVKASEVLVEYDADATINAKSNILTVDGHKYALNSNTKFLVRELNDKDEYVYKTYSLKDLPAYKDGSAEIYFTVGANDFVTNVYVKTAVDAASMSKYIFVPNAATSNVEWVVKDQEYKVKVFINGEAQTVLASKKIVATLAQNEGKLFAAEWYDDSDDNHASSSANIYGSLKSVDLVNEYTDGEFSAQATTVDYVTGKKLVNSTLTTYTNYKKTAIENNWELDGATIIDADGKKVEIAQLATEDGIWVVSEKTDYSSVALYVYVGTALRNNTELTASYKTDAADAKDVNLTFEDGKAEAALTGTDKLASLTYAAEDHNAYVETPNQNEWLVVKNDDASKVYLKGVDEDVIYQVGKYTVTSTAESFNQTITVTAEDGVTTETYTIKVTNTAHSCKDVTWDNSKITYTLAWDGDAVKVTVDNNSTLTVKDLKDALYIHEAGSEKACATAQGIVIYDTVIGNTAHVAEDTLKLTVGMTDLVAIATAEDGTTYQFSITVVAQ